MLTHKIFLSWLIYFVTVILVASGLYYLNIIQLAVLSDHSYLTELLIGMYLVCETLSLRQSWKISKEHVLATNVSNWLKKNDITGIQIGDNDNVTLLSNGNSYIVKSSEVSRHIISLRDMAAGRNRVNATILLDVLESNLFKQVSVVEFIAGRVVWIGILATIFGVILAFWPFRHEGLEGIKLHLTEFFSAIAVAFIPTAASFVFKIALDFGTRIISSGVDEIVTMLARTGETKLLPILEAEAERVKKGQ